ncbi:type I methionyl aminopeptidase [Polyangium aurulentum]|uniref:type I methionyl aminopeptidase n=1 Tax=Polyangium aurulentum TaxID=2567896 RepID=UPI0010ADD1E0|nr:type I methionyl aminopeptidase [Polyangium aurulentum]UQA62545.1 type I methionyl aminopeptidase [Polyangium aurulentum]
MSVEIKTLRDVEALRVVGRMAAETLMLAGAALRAGMTTADIDRIVHEDTIRRGARPSQLGYHGFPRSVCTSRNEVVCHGIPGPERIEDGDIINIDVTSLYGGFHGDTSATFYVGKPSPEARHVVEVSRRCLARGIAQIREDARLGDIGAAIEELARSEGCSVVREIVGHGIGRSMHMAPSVAHVGTRGSGLRLRAGMVFTVEPIINLGGPEVEFLADGWTVVTRDRSLSAQFEHTVVVTKRGCEILTARPGPLVNSEELAGSPA